MSKNILTWSMIDWLDDGVWMHSCMGIRIHVHGCMSAWVNEYTDA